MKTFAIAAAGALLLGAPGQADEVIPEKEKARAQALLADGPTKTAGIAGVSVIGTVSLDGEFESSDGLVMRVRELVIEPGGVVAVHQHDKRPGVAYIIEGEMTEHRSSEAGSMVKSAGMTAMERSGVVHWWENASTANARVLVVDIVPAE
ncbi:MAG: cupin domain-containing protein [Pseudomonadota bacterium]